MKKIFFSERFGLTQAVLEGRKTMTRQIIKAPKKMEGKDVYGFAVVRMPGSNDVVEVFATDADGAQINNILPKYKVGEVVAVAQAYKECGYDPDMLQQAYVSKPTIFPDLDQYSPLCGWVDLPLKYHKGWNNKMFVLAGLLPHRIRITNVRVERLQDISEEDCLREGIIEDCPGVQYSFPTEIGYCGQYPFYTPRGAFADLIDKVSGKGTFESNPYVFVYEFELVK